MPNCLLLREGVDGFSFRWVVDELECWCWRKKTEKRGMKHRDSLSLSTNTTSQIRLSSVHQGCRHPGFLDKLARKLLIQYLDLCAMINARSNDVDCKKVIDVIIQAQPLTLVKLTLNTRDISGSGSLSRAKICLQSILAMQSQLRCIIFCCPTVVLSKHSRYISVHETLRKSDRKVFPP